MPTYIYFSIDDRIQTLALDIYGHCSKSSFINNNDFFVNLFHGKQTRAISIKEFAYIIGVPHNLMVRHADGAMNLLKIMHICKLVRD